MKPVLKNYSKFGYESRFWRSQIYVDSKAGSVTCHKFVIARFEAGILFYFIPKS